MNYSTPITKTTVFKNSIWKLLESFGSKGISMLVSIVLARIIMPEAYGVIALTSVFINLTDLLIQAGFSTTLIRKEKATDEDYSTVLCISIISSIFLYSIIFVTSPWIADFYGTPKLCPVLRVMALTLFCQAFAAVRTATFTRAMKFKTLCAFTMISNITSGVIGIAIALLGFDVWALVLQQLSQQIILTILLLATIRVKYRFCISRESITEIVPPSLKILSSSLLSFAGDSMYSMVIGKVYSMEDLAYTEKGALFPRNFALYTFSAVSAVFLPVFASYQKDYEKLNSIFRRVLGLCCYIILPMMAGLCMIAEPLISVILTDKWLPAVGLFRWNCLYYLATPIMLANVQLHFAIGKNETRIKTEVIRIVMLSIMLIIFINKKVPITTIAAVVAFIQIAIAIFIMFETKKATGFKLMDIVIDAFPSLISTGLMCVAVFMILKMPFSDFLLLVLGSTTGVLVYWLSSIILKNPAYIEVINMARPLFRGKRGGGQ